MVNRTDSYQYFTNSIQRETLEIMPPGVRSVLDVGGGSGDYAIAAKTATGATTAATIDISPDAIADKRPDIDIAELCDLETAGSIEGFWQKHQIDFDLILCLDVLEHLVDPWRLIKRLHQLMPLHGYLLASIPNVQNYRVVLRSASGNWHYKDSGIFDRTHLRYFSRRSAVALMTGTGLSVAKVGRTFGPSKLDHALHRMSVGALDPWVTMQNLVLVQKTSDIVAEPGFYGENIPNS